jgi:hypothetical protein
MATPRLMDDGGRSLSLCAERGSVRFSVSQGHRANAGPERRFYVVRATCDVLYAPLDWASLKSVPLRDARRWYAHLFVR